MKILAQRPTHVSAIAIVLLITKIFTVKYYDRRINKNRTSIIIINETATATEMIPKKKKKKKKAVKNNWIEKVNKQKTNKKHFGSFTERAGTERDRQRQTVSK